jgi:cysteinyl-tRNA synthetase
MRLHNTLTGAIEELTPVEAGKVGIYVCGVTPYAESHVGHAMNAIVYDVLVRYLRWAGNPAGGYEVTFVSNYTDVDDKLIDRAAELNLDPLDLANQNIAQWEDEQRALNLTFPDVRPRVTSHIEPIVALVRRLIDGGHAYATASGDVYFRVRSDEDYGKLSHRNIEELRTGTRFEPGEGKEFPLDFALWKAQKPGEPAWESPWGSGRPGWHIECSAMSQQYLGDTLDIHGGGMDLVFPHHENEVAQSESATGKPFARIWMHSGMVQFDGQKMSKSIGNVVSVREALQRWSPDALRLFVLGSHYRSPNNLTDEAMSAAERGVERLLVALRPAAGGRPSSADGLEERARFVAAMEDDFNTAQALAALFDLVRTINRGRDAGEDVRYSQATLRELTSVFGLTLEEQEGDDEYEVDEAERQLLLELARPYGSFIDLTALQSEPRRVGVIQGILQIRQALRAARRFEDADLIRRQLGDLGFELEDKPGGHTTWRKVATSSR